jgi:hypothetical protein
MGTNFSGKCREIMNSLFRVMVAILCDVFSYGCSNGKTTIVFWDQQHEY